MFSFTDSRREDAVLESSLSYLVVAGNLVIAGKSWVAKVATRLERIGRKFGRSGRT